MTETTTPAHRRWDPIVRISHWSIALAVLANAVFTEEGSGPHIWVGYRHAVPPEHLVGFIYQSGSNAALRRKLKEGAIEPGFEASFRRGPLVKRK